MSAEGRARRRSAGARGGAGAAAAAAPEHPRGSESRQPASPAPQKERPRRLARHLPPQCPRPSRGRAWTRLSKCGSPALPPRETKASRPGAAGWRGRRARRLQVRARSVPLAPFASRGAPPSSRVAPGALGEGLGARRQGEGVGLAPPRAPPGYLGRTSKPPRARKFTREQAQGELGGAQVQSRERSGLGSAPFSPSAFLVPILFVHLILERGT